MPEFTSERVPEEDLHRMLTVTADMQALSEALSKKGSRLYRTVLSVACGSCEEALGTAGMPSDSVFDPCTAGGRGNEARSFGKFGGTTLFTGVATRSPKLSQMLACSSLDNCRRT